MGQIGRILSRIKGLHGNALKCVPSQILNRPTAQFLFRDRAPCGFVVCHFRLLFRMTRKGAYEYFNFTLGLCGSRTYMYL